MIGSGINCQRDRWNVFTNRLSRYDIALIAIPLLFVGMVAIGWIFGLPTPLKIVLGGVLAGAIVTDVLFINPPSPLQSHGDRPPKDRHESHVGQ